MSFHELGVLNTTAKTLSMRRENMNTSFVMVQGDKERMAHFHREASKIDEALQDIEDQRRDLRLKLLSPDE